MASALRQRIALDPETVHDLGMNEEPSRYHLETFAAIALSRPASGSTKLKVQLDRFIFLPLPKKPPIGYQIL
jgi:hypothetical protein